MKNSYLYLFIFFLCCFVLFSNGRFGGDGLENYLTAQSIVLDRSLCIYNRPFEVKEMRRVDFEAAASGGKHYSSFGIGMPLLLVPLYLLGHIASKFITGVPHDYITQFFVSFTNPILVALTAVMLFNFLSRLGFRARTSFLTVLCYGFSTMSIIYTRSGFSEPAIGLLVLLSVFFLYRYEENGSLKNIMAVGILAGYALLIKDNSFLYFPLLLLYLLYKTLGANTKYDKLRLWLILCIPLAVFTSLYFYFHSFMSLDIATGKTNVYKEIIYRSIPENLQMLKGIVYYLFSTGKGYFFYNIALVLGLFGIKGMLQKKRTVAIFILAIILANLFFYSFRFNRGSLFSWGPRYMYPTVPLMCIFLAEFIEISRSLAKKILLHLFLICGFLIQLPCLFINFSNYFFFVKEQLGAQEYMINYIPGLSPIIGAWYLFMSAILRTLTGRSLDFIYNPDSLFVAPIKKSLGNYDTWDVWWVNVTKISPNLLPAVVIAVLFLIIIALVCFAKLRQPAKR